MLNRENLHAYQNKAIQFVKDNKKSSLFMDLGLGKSVSTLTAIADMSDSFEIAKTLVIAPLRVANNTWHNEIANWGHLQHLTYVICTGSEKNRVANLMRDVDIYIINRENVKWLVEYYKTKWPFDLVVIDESSSFKSHSSQRWKALRKTIPYTDRMVQLTATPATNGLLDLWPQIYLLDSGERLGRNMTAFKSRYFESDFMGYKFEPKAGAKEQIYKAIEDVALTMKATDYLDMPDRVDVIEPAPISAKLMKQYKELEKEFILNINDNEIVAKTAGVLANKLLQFCSGAIYTDEYQNVSVLHDAKLDALQELVEQNPNENLLVAYNYKTDLIRLRERFPDAVVLDKEGLAIDEWNKGNIKMLLAHPASAGHGLNLQKGGSVIVWFGLNWSLELYQQFNGRLYRQGQKNSVRIVHLVVPETIDEKVMTAIQSKAETQDQLLNYLKNTMK